MLRYSAHILISLLSLSLWFSVVSCQEKRYHAEVARVNLDTVPEHLQTVYEWQRNKNEYFLDPSTSPLRPKEKKKFDGLEFFIPTSDYQVKALFREALKIDTIQMKTTTVRSRMKSFTVIYSFSSMIVAMFYPFIVKLMP
jgi:hypothetical protein